MCGIIGVIGVPSASSEVYHGLLLLQHRGQDAAGIFSYTDAGSGFVLHKNQGLVDQVFNLDNLEKLEGQMAIGHTRYSTIGNQRLQDIQPLITNYPYGIGMVHNGNIVNAQELVIELKEKHKRHMFGSNDLEVLLNLFAGSVAKSAQFGQIEFSHILEAVNEIYQKAKGGYSVLTYIAHHGLVAFRDPHGIRPLILGERELSKSEQEINGGVFKKAYCFASESNALTFLGYSVVRNVEAGEVIYIKESGEIISANLIDKKKDIHVPCMFEWVYFANPQSEIDHINVYEARKNMGIILAQKIRAMIANGEISPDIVAPVPETSRISAIFLAQELGLPYREVLTKNRYVQRSFILNSELLRSRALSLKFGPIINEVHGKKILLLDDSIVRGNTSKKIVRMLKECGAKEVYFASACPPVKFPCYYGIDFPDPKELVATDRSNEKIAEFLDAERVIYLGIDNLKKAIGREHLCTACLTGEYPVDISSANKFKELRNQQRKNS